MTGDNLCVANNVTAPIYQGKGNGDANCDGVVDGTDYSVWRKEFMDISEGGQESSNSWEADFTGSDGICDGVVNGIDYSKWKGNYLKYTR
jgi:hypothetical protein